MIAFIENGSIVKNNVSLKEVRQRFPNTSFAYPLEGKDLEEDFGIVTVQDSNRPSFDTNTHSLREVNPEQVDGVWFRKWELVPHSDEELAKIAEKNSSQVRFQRNELLNQTDWTQLPDASVDAATWATYRQALRDLPSQDGFPNNITWPTQP